MKKNTIQLAKKSTVLLLGLFMQINFAHSNLLPTTTEFSSICTGDNLTVEGNNFVLPNSDIKPSLTPNFSYILNTCQTNYIPAKARDTINVIVKTTLPNTKLFINAIPLSSPIDEAFVLTTSQYSRPGVYKFTFFVKNYSTNNSRYNFYARGEAINNQRITTETSPISVNISNITEINAQKKNPIMPF
ncbi:MAG: hypothetical protein RL344_1402 [Pseudomonadota bacterium]|jgi:hypothetical protein